MKQLMENYKAKYPCSRMINRKKKVDFESEDLSLRSNSCVYQEGKLFGSPKMDFLIFKTEILRTYDLST